MDQISRIGMDTSKHFFQLHGVNAAEMPVLRKKLRRKDVVAFFEKLSPTVIALEACGAADKIKVAEAIRAMNLTTGPAAQCFPGPIKFDDKGRRQDVPLIFAQWQKGEPVTVFPTDLALGKPYWLAS